MLACEVAALFFANNNFNPLLHFNFTLDKCLSLLASVIFLLEKIIIIM